ncbi:hypothetical protein ABW19_dt0203955 [Dactylella cylindrospora]|nr:hypothetical protein ABW19_dt0203955 [Dactylella cylindrospora]
MASFARMVGNVGQKVSSLVQTGSTTGVLAARRERDEQARAIGFCSYECQTKEGICSECEGFGELLPFSGLGQMDPKSVAKYVGVFSHDPADARDGDGTTLKIEEDEPNNALRVLRKRSEGWTRVGYLIQKLPDETVVVPREKLITLRKQLLDRSGDIQHLQSLLQAKDTQLQAKHNEVESMRRHMYSLQTEVNGLRDYVRNQRSRSNGEVEETKRRMEEHYNSRIQKLQEEKDQMNQKILEHGYETETVSDETYRRDYEGVKNRLMSSVPNFCHAWYQTEAGKIQCEKGECVYNESNLDKILVSKEEVDFYKQCEAISFKCILEEVSKQFCVGFEEAILKAADPETTTHAIGLDENLRFMREFFTSLSRSKKIPLPFSESDRSAFNTWRAAVFRTLQTVHQATSRKDRGKEALVADSMNKIVDAVVQQLGDFICYGSSKGGKDTPPASLVRCIKAIVQFTTKLGTSRAEFYFDEDILGLPFDTQTMEPIPTTLLDKFRPEDLVVKKVMFPSLVKRGDDGGQDYDKTLQLAKADVLLEKDRNAETAPKEERTSEATIKGPPIEPDVFYPALQDPTTIPTLLMPGVKDEKIHDDDFEKVPTPPPHKDYSKDADVKEEEKPEFILNQKGSRRRLVKQPDTSFGVRYNGTNL